MKVSDVDVTAVTGFYAALLERGSVGRPVSVETVRGVHRVLSMILKRATVDGLLKSNPCIVAKAPKDHGIHGQDDEPGIDPEDARQLVVTLEDSAVHTIAAVALGTGLRRSELLGLQWRDIDLEAGELRVVGKLEQVGGRVERTTVKTKRSRRTVPFGPNVAAVLRQQKAITAEAQLPLKKDGLWVDGGWVFPIARVAFKRDGTVLPAGRAWPPDAFAKVWRRAIREANERRLGVHVAGGGRAEDFAPLKVGIHALRHCYGTAQFAAGVRDELISRRMGHSSSLVTRRIYSHVVDEERRDGIDAVDGLLRG